MDKFIPFSELIGRIVQEQGEKGLERLKTCHHFFQKKVVPFGWVGDGDPNLLWERHIIDSVAPFILFPSLSKIKTIIDIGSGPGLPLFPILALYPEKRGILIEPKRRYESLYLSFQREFSPIHLSWIFQEFHKVKSIPETQGANLEEILLVTRAVSPISLLEKKLGKGLFSDLPKIYFFGSEQKGILADLGSWLGVTYSSGKQRIYLKKGAKGD